MRNIIIGMLMIPAFSFGHGNQSHSNLGDGNNINNCSPVLKCEPKIIYSTHKQQARIAQLEAQVAQLHQQNKALASNYDKLEQQYKTLVTKYNKAVYIIHHPTKKEIKRRPVNKNAITLLGAVSKTDLKTESNDVVFKAKTEYEPDLGLMYQRDFGRIRCSFGATINGTGLLVIGLNF